MSHRLEEISESECQRIALLFKMMGDPTRLRILLALSGSSLCVMHISERVGMSQSATSHQLALLRKADLVRVTRSGKSLVYSLADDHVRQMLALSIVHGKEKRDHE
ncbi:MAG: winged helix-turn-helix transcriptional regulator [Clostridia bacterium]|nr:winged helix-turn-helix transcriptional regulator [Clostridia bacterium]